MTQRRKRNKKWISWIIILALLIGAGVVCFLVKKTYFDDKKEPEGDNSSQSITPEKKETVPKKKEEEKTKEEEPVEEKEKVQQYDGTDPNVASSVTGVITYAGVSGDQLMIRVNIDQYLNGGKCTLGLRQDGGNIYSAEANIVDSAATSTCEGFNIPVAGLPKGNINIVIYISSGDKNGEITGEVTL